MLLGEKILKSIRKAGGFGKRISELEEEFDVDRRVLGQFLKDEKDVKKVSKRFYKYYGGSE